MQIGFGGAQDEQDEQNWFWHADLAPVPKQGDRVTIVRATNPKEPACVGHVGQTGTVTHTDGKGRPYQVGFDGLELWFWPSDVFPAVPADDTKARAPLPQPLRWSKLADTAGHRLRASAAQTMPSSIGSMRFFPSKNYADTCNIDESAPILNTGPWIPCSRRGVAEQTRAPWL